MRDIKFRAWDGKKMINPSCVKHGKACVIRPYNKDDSVLTHKGVNYYSDWDVDWPADYPLMQYTGLKDKNGVEIYEGDLVKHVRYVDAQCDYSTSEPLNLDGEYTRVGHVTITTSKGVTLNGRQYFTPDDASEKTERAYNENPNRWADFSEVIGNIHENPDLLEQSK